MKPRWSKAIILCILTAAFLCGQSAWAAGVRPLVVDIDAAPGDTKEFELVITPSSSEETVDLNLYQPVQLLTGNLTYQEPDVESYPAVKWMTLEKSSVQVYPGQETTVKGTVKVPFDAGGSHTVVIMVEPQPPAGQTGIVFKVRYAVRVNIRVDRPGLRRTAALKSFDLVPGEEKEPLIKTTIANTSAWDYLVSGEVTIRDKERRLVARLPMQSMASLSSNSDSTRMYPGSEVEYIAEITKRLSPGEYTLRAFFRYGDHGQIIETKNVTVAEGQFNFPSLEEIGAFSVQPTELQLKLAAGQRKTEALQLISEIGEDAKIVVSGRDVESQYKYSPLSWVELRSPAEFDLKGRGRGRLVLTVAVPRDTESASYHGDIVLTALSADGESFLSQRAVPLSVVVGNSQTPDAEVRSLTPVWTEEGLSLSLDLYNSGNIFLVPQASILITDSDGAFAARALLTIPEGVARVLPLKSQELSGVIESLDPGTYKANIVIQSEGKDVASTELPLEIPALEGSDSV